MPAALVDSKIQDFSIAISIVFAIGAASQLEFMLPYSLIRILILFVLIHFYDIGSLGYCRLIDLSFSFLLSYALARCRFIDDDDDDFEFVSPTICRYILSDSTIVRSSPMWIYHC